MDFLSIPNYYIKKGRPTGTVTERSQGTAKTTSRTRSRRNTRRRITWVSTTGSFAMNSSARTCLTQAAMKKCVVRWTNWRTKTTRTTLIQMNFEYIYTIYGFVRTQLVPIRCPLGIELTSNKHCLPCDSSKTKRIQLIGKDGKVLPHLGGAGKDHGGLLILTKVTKKTYPVLIDQGNLMTK